MKDKESWLNWINDQLKDMYNDKGYTDININRVFKTTEDDRQVAEHLLLTFKSLIEEKDER